jgi:pyruvate kinase
MTRRTRIVATLGPATDRPGVLEKLLELGLDVARINFSHGAAEEHTQRIQHFRDVSKRVGRTTAVLADLPGPKLRCLLGAPLEVATGKSVGIALKPSSKADVHVTEPEAVARLRTGQRVLLDDGRLQARVTQVAGDTATLVFDVGGTLLPNKGINLPDTELSIPAVTHRDRDALAIAAKAGVDWLALSFVRDASAAAELRGVARGFGLEVPILAKMERPEAVRKSKEIIAAFDGIMVARGDLGVEIALEKVPHVQKKLIHQARLAGKPVITATDMLDSMRNNPRPTRAEASDVANAVYDGTDAVMLSGETAVGSYPIESLRCMDTILREAEGHLESDGPGLLKLPKGSITDRITNMTVDLALEIGAEAIIAPTLTGRTSRMVARHRPGSAIVSVSTNEEVARQQCLVWGVKAVMVQFPIQKGDDRIEAAIRAAFEGEAVQPGALVVVLAGHPVEGGEGFPTIRVVRVCEGGRSGEP